MELFWSMYLAVTTALPVQTRQLQPHGWLLPHCLDVIKMLLGIS